MLGDDDAWHDARQPALPLQPAPPKIVPVPHSFLFVFFVVWVFLGVQDKKNTYTTNPMGIVVSCFARQVLKKDMSRALSTAKVLTANLLLTGVLFFFSLYA